MAKRLELESCAGLVIDVQEYFLKEIPAEQRVRIETMTAYFVNLLTYLRIPILCTIERPVAKKGGLPGVIEAGLSRGSSIIEKDFFDLTAQPEVLSALAAFGRKQMIITGCETEVCVLQSCLGLLNLGYEVFVIEDLLFSGSEDCSAALSRMKAEGVIFMNFKTLYHELLRAASGSPHRKTLEVSCGPLPAKLVDP
jgi:isochorismate hydrolase